MTLVGVLLSLFSMFPCAHVLASGDAAMTVDMADPSKWIQVTYNKIPPNKVSFAVDGLTVQVTKSASPLIYKLPAPVFIQGFSVKAQFKQMDLEATLHSKFRREDSPLRVGLVLEGDKSLGFFQRKLAADWVLKLFALASKGQGISHIEFYNIAWSPEDLNFSRTHPKSDLMKEKWFGVPDKNKSIESFIAVQPTSKVLALWISIDGDDIGLEYETKIQHLKLYPRESQH